MNSTHGVTVWVVWRVCVCASTSYVPLRDRAYTRDDIDFFFGFCFFVLPSQYIYIPTTRVHYNTRRTVLFFTF